MLTSLFLDHNQLNGDIPPELGNLVFLIRLDMETNQLTKMPPELGNLINLRDLDLNTNQLSGSIPPQLGNLVNLQELKLYRNQLTGSIPPQLGDLRKLTDLSLGENQLSGSVPQELGNLEKLLYLDLSDNQLSGNIASEIGNLTTLERLFLNNNPIVGPLPFSLTDLSGLNTFWFNDTELCEPAENAFQAWLAGISSLKRTGFICESLEPVSPKNWTMVLSLRPTFKWRGVSGVQTYRLSLYHDSGGEALGQLIDIFQLSPQSTSDPYSPGGHRYKLGIDLSSGTTRKDGGYLWKVEALDNKGKIIASSLFTGFQIPSLGGSWDQALENGLCNYNIKYHGVCLREANRSLVPNEYWNEYDDMIYRWSERWDIPPALVKAIMIGETFSALGPRKVGGKVFPPTRAYMYEPQKDYEYYIEMGEALVHGISMFRQPENPPDQEWIEEKLGPYSFPYESPVQSGTTIYRFTTERGQFSNISGLWGIEDCEKGKTEGCPATKNVAQYRTAASYGLGQIVYMFIHTDLGKYFASFFRSEDPPVKIPPEELYEPDLNINVMGYELHKKRCFTSSHLGASDREYELWRYVVLAYNGGNNRDYDDAVIARAKKFVQPTSVVDAGWEPYIQVEATVHNCAAPFDQATDSMAFSGLSQWTPGGEIELTSAALDLRGDGTQVWLALSAIQDATFGSYKGVIRIYKDENRTTLLWESPQLGYVKLMAASQLVDFGDYPLLLVDWVSGLHATTTYPVQWDGTTFNLMPTFDLEGIPTDGIGSDGGGVFFSNGSLVSLQHTYEKFNQRLGIEWSYEPSGIKQDKTFLIEWPTDFIYLPLAVKTE